VNALSLLMAASRPLYRAREPTQRHLHKCPVTVGEYSSIFFHRSLLTPTYSRNFTLRTLRSSFDWGLSRSEVRILRPVADPPTLWCRRFRSPAGRRLLHPATPGVPRPGRALLPSSDPGGSEVPTFSSLVGLRRCFSPCTHSARPDKSSTLAFPVEGYPPTFQASEVPQVKDNLRRYQREGCSFSPTGSSTVL
jgi:hypothetical protein